MATKKLTAKQLEGLIISVGEARKLLGSSSKNLTDDEVAQQVLSMNEMAIHLLKVLDLQKNNYNYVSSI